MAVIYSILPVDETFDTERVKQWLEDNEIELTSNLVRGRYPTINELQSVLRQFNGEFHRTAFVLRGEIGTGNQRLVLEATPDNETIHHLTFDGQFETVAEFCRELSKRCGSMVLLTDGESPYLISP